MIKANRLCEIGGNYKRQDSGAALLGVDFGYTDDMTVRVIVEHGEYSTQTCKPAPTRQATSRAERQDTHDD